MLPKKERINNENNEQIINKIIWNAVNLDNAEVKILVNSIKRTLDIEIKLDSKLFPMKEE